MVIELKKYESFGESNTQFKGSGKKASGYQSPRNAFVFYLNETIIKIVGKNVIVTKPSHNSFMISASNLDSITTPTKINTRNVLRVPVGLIDEWNDLGIYEVDDDHENECVYINKL